MTPRACLVFAAGMGTRMGSLTLDRPKPLIPVAGRTLLDHALAQVTEAGLPRSVVNTHYKAEMIAAHLAGRPIAISHEPERLETGGGLRAALPLLGAGPVLTMNSDAVWRGGNPIRQIIAQGLPQGARAMLLCVPGTRAQGHPGQGDFTLSKGRLVRGGDLVYTGVQIIDPSLLDTIPDRVFSLNRAWDIAAAQGALHGCVYDGDWCDVGQPETIPLAEALLQDV